MAAGRKKQAVANNELLMPAMSAGITATPRVVRVVAGVVVLLVAAFAFGVAVRFVEVTLFLVIGHGLRSLWGEERVGAGEGFPSPLPPLRERRGPLA